MAYGIDLITAIAEAVHPMGVMQRITDQTLDLIDPARGVMVGLSDPTGVTYVTGAGNQTTLIGTHVELGTSLSGLAMSTGTLQRSDDTELDSRVDLEACRRHFVRSLVCLPLAREGVSIGVLAVNAPEPNAFTDEQVALLGHLAEFISVAIGSARDLHRVSTELIDLHDDLYDDDGDHEDGPPSGAADYVVGVLSPLAADRLGATRRIRQVLTDPDLLTIVHQPVVDLATGDAIAVEALARFAVTPYLPPDVWFAEAHGCGLGIELELLALTKALATLPDLDPQLSLTVNLGPDAARSPAFEAALVGLPVERVILELTEHAVVEDYSGLIASLRELRRRGLRVAIDDTGSGYSSLAHILKVAPDFIKLDRELASGIDLDPVRRALASSLVTFAAETGAQIVAEGIETDDELAVIRRLGIGFGQGYLLGAPGPIGEVVLHHPRVQPPVP